jgi:hypothetical protein
MARLRVGVVGIGFVGAAHVDAIRRIPNAEVVALASSSEERAVRHAADLGVPRAYPDYHALLADPEIEVVHNCTPNVWHLDVNRAILEAGKACFAEKPLAMNAAEAAELVRIAQATGVPAAVNFNHRGFPQAQEARALVEAGRLGGRPRRPRQLPPGLAAPGQRLELAARSGRRRRLAGRRRHRVALDGPRSAHRRRSDRGHYGRSGDHPPESPAPERRPRDVPGQRR